MKILLIIPLILLLLFLRFCAKVIKRLWIDKKPVSVGDQIAGQSIVKQFQNKDKKTAIECIQNIDQEKEKKQNTGEK